MPLPHENGPHPKRRIMYPFSDLAISWIAEGFYLANDLDVGEYEVLECVVDQWRALAAMLHDPPLLWLTSIPNTAAERGMQQMKAAVIPLVEVYNRYGLDPGQYGILKPNRDTMR